MRRRTRGLRALIAAVTLGSTAIVVLPATADAATKPAATTSGLVTRTLSVSMSCSIGVGPPGTGPLDDALTNLVVQVTAPATVAFGGSITYTGFRYAVTVAPSGFGETWTQLYAGPATHAVPEGHVSIGTSLVMPAAGRYTSLVATSGPFDVRGNVGDVVALPVQQLTAQWHGSSFPYLTETEICTPVFSFTAMTSSRSTRSGFGVPVSSAYASSMPTCWRRSRCSSTRLQTALEVSR